MAVSVEQLKVGAVFEFKTAARRVVSVGEKIGRGFNVTWEYADGQKRGGRLGGKQWMVYFCKEAIRELTDPSLSGEDRILLDGSTVRTIRGLVDVKITTHCPEKWALVDMETGDVWGQGGQALKRIDSARVRKCLEAAEARNKGVGIG